MRPEGCGAVAISGGSAHEGGVSADEHRPHRSASRRLPPLLATRVFECVARHRSFTRAADELCVTQAAVSHQIKALEEWLGAPLFQRLSRSIKLTELGERLAGPLGQAFDLMAEATDQALFPERQSLVTVAAFDSFTSAWIVPRLHKFRARFPDVDVRFIAKRQEDDALSTGEADIEIRYGSGGWNNLQVELLFEEAVLPVCSPALLEQYGQPADISEIDRYPLIHDVFVVDWDEFISRQSIDHRVTRRGYGFTHSHLVKRACMAGLGIALGRWPLVAEELRSGELVRPFDAVLKLDAAYYLTCRRDMADKGEVKAFAYWLLDEAEQFTAQYGLLPS